MVTIWARGPLMPLLMLMPMLVLSMVTIMDMVTTVTLMAMVITDMPMLTMDTMDIPTTMGTTLITDIIINL